MPMIGATATSKMKFFFFGFATHEIATLHESHIQKKQPIFDHRLFFHSVVTRKL